MTLDRKIVGEAMQQQTTFYDKEEDKYNLLSALQKSVRGSDPHAAVHYSRKAAGGRRRYSDDRKASDGDGQ